MLDSYGDGDPGRAVREATSYLSSTKPAPGPLTQAQLYAILADAHMQASQPQQARAAISAAIKIIDTLPPSPDIRRLRHRVMISDADVAEESGDSANAVKMLDALVAEVPVDSLERACALDSRLEAHFELGEPDKAAADGIAAYHIAEEGGWTNARIGAAYGLATIYAQAGLLENAEKMSDEVIAVARSEGRAALLASAEWGRGRILIEQRRYPEALEALKVNRESSEQIGDRVGIAAADTISCIVLVAQQKFSEAERTCDHGDAEFTGAKRTDLVSLLHAVRGEIALGQGRPREALVALNEVLGPTAGRVPPFYVPQFYRDRASAHNALGESREAYEDVTQAFELEKKASLAQRLRAVTVLSAMAETEKLITDNRMLEQRVARQRDELSNQQIVRRLWTGFSVITGLLAALFGYLLVVTRRQSRALRRQETIVRTVASHAPDALVLLDESRLVRFSNRNLFGAPGPHPVGQPLAGGIPLPAQPVLRTAIDEIFAKKMLVTCTVNLVDEAGDVRCFELSGGPAIEEDRLIGAVLRSIDVTAVRRLEREVIDVSSRERQRLSGDLHEGLGQELTGVLLLARSMLTGMDRGQPASREHVAQVMELIASSISSTREIARGLSPVNIERGSLTDALTRLAEESGRRLGIAISVKSDPAEIVVSDVAADHLYRIAYEAITNAARHGGCERIDIGLRTDDDDLELTVTDDGSKPAPALDGGFEGLGLKMMAYRARLVGGSIHLGAAGSRGTRLTVRAPLAQVTPNVGAETRP